MSQEASDSVNSDLNKKKKSNLVPNLCIIAIAGALLFLLYYHFIQPYFSDKTIDKYREMYYSTTEVAAETQTVAESDKQTDESIEGDTETAAEAATKEVKVSKNFSALVEYNPDIRGWVTIPGTNIDYPVVQATEEKTDYYLTHNVDGEVDKNGTVFIDYRTPITETSKAIFVNGHNMKSTGLMFHELVRYKNLDFYCENPVITFDTLYGDSEWKVFSLIKTNNDERQGERFNFYRSSFDSDEDFMEFVYQLKVRSIFECPVDINEDDTLLMLSTCTYEMNDMRFVVVARKLRDGESADIDTSRAYVREAVLYPDGWYLKYPKAVRPVITSFKDSYAAGEIDWYSGRLY